MTESSPVVCLEMDDASGRDKREGRWAKLDDWRYYRDFLRDVGASVTIAIEPQKASGGVLSFLAANRDVFLPTVHGTVKYGHYGGDKTESQIREMWEWTVNEIQKFGFDMGLDSNGIFIPPMHMISDTAVDVLHSYGVKVIGSETNNFPLGSREVRNSKGELVYRLSSPVEAYSPYRGVVFYKRFKPWMLKADIFANDQLMGGIKAIEGASSRAKKIAGSFDTYWEMCERDFMEHCLHGRESYYAHEINLGGERPYTSMLERLAEAGRFKGARFVDAKELAGVR